MNSINHLGGMTCFGKVNPKENDGVFHEEWERRAFALNMASLAFFGPVDRARHATEKMDAIHYLASPYYEKWLTGIEIMGKDLGYLNDEEIETGKAQFTKELSHPAPNAEMVAGLVQHGMSSAREEGRLEPAFKVGDKVCARKMETHGHTRAALYVRGKVGTVVMCHGTHVFADTHAHDQGENPQPLYCVRFEARELWGDNVERKDCTHIDLWEDHLEAVE